MAPFYVFLLLHTAMGVPLPSTLSPQRPTVTVTGPTIKQAQPSVELVEPLVKSAESSVELVEPLVKSVEPPVSIQSAPAAQPSPVSAREWCSGNKTIVIGIPPLFNDTYRVCTRPCSNANDCHGRQFCDTTDDLEATGFCMTPCNATMSCPRTQVCATRAHGGAVCMSR